MSYEFNRTGMSGGREITPKTIILNSGISQNIQLLCNDYDPSWWFPQGSG